MRDVSVPNARQTDGSTNFINSPNEFQFHFIREIVVPVINLKTEIVIMIMGDILTILEHNDDVVQNGLSVHVCIYNVYDDTVEHFTTIMSYYN